MVADGDRGPGAHQQEGDRLADDLGVADDDRLQALEFQACGLQQLHRGRGRAGGQIDLVVDDVADRRRVHALDVLHRIDRALQGAQRDVPGGGALDDHPGHPRVGVQGAHRGVEFLLSDALGEIALLEGDAGLGGAAPLVADIELDGGGVPDGDRHQLGMPALGGQIVDLLAHLGDDPVGQRLAAQVVRIGIGHRELHRPGGQAEARGALAVLAARLNVIREGAQPLARIAASAGARSRLRRAYSAAILPAGAYSNSP